MGKSLIIAEKPSVAQDISRAIGGFSKQQTSKSAGRDGEYLESDGYVLSSAVGHLVELCMPNEMDKKRGKWSFAALPIIPEKFALKPIAKTEARLKLLKRLIKRDDVDTLINACDAGREGELIFRYIVDICGVNKPIKRLWLQSMTQGAIRDGFQSLKDGQELEPLAAAAVCRSESDWLVGINGTRALTAFNSKNGGFQLTPVGRVQTPTLSLVVKRDEQIKAFVPKDYWEIHATFGAEAGAYGGRWFNEAFKKADREENEHARAERLWDAEKAEAIRAKCEGKPGIVTEEKKPSTQAPPLLYDLTTLQREANGRFGFSARGTLQIAQALYEKHKVLTYPRTDSRALPEDYLPQCRDTLSTLAGGTLREHAERVAKNDWVKPNKRIFNNAKISDHHAIIPTTQAPKTLSEPERKLYDMVAQRFLAVFHPSAKFEVTTRITRVEEEAFKTDGKILIEAGWLAVYGKRPGQQGDDTLAAVKDGEQVSTDEIEVLALATRPPAHYTEATLLSAMEGAGKFVDAEEFRDAMAEKGLGTPATRAAIIEGLLREGYLHREGRELWSTAKAVALLDLLKAIEIKTLQSPEMTGEWEHRLKEIEAGTYTREAFMGEIARITNRIVEKAKTFDEDKFEAKQLDVQTPDGQAVSETLREYRSADGKLAIRKVVAGRLIEPVELQELLNKRFIGPLTGFRSKQGWPFNAALRLNDENKTEFVFDNEPVDEEGNKIDFTKQEPVGICPIDGGKIYETLGSYACENSFAEDPTCKFKIGKKILEQEITIEQARKILTERKSDLLEGFVSKRTKRKFKAWLVLNDANEVKFEFPEREAKPKGKGGKGGFKRKGTTKTAK